ncbi:MAG: NAD(P)H-dependent glycerol-3-phosphate dehydrogenase [Chitinophagaceae bacterium]
MFRFGVIGGGSWATALVKILTDNKLPVNWWVRSEQVMQHIQQRHHNPNYLSSVYFDTSLLKISTHIEDTIADSECIIIAMPSAYVTAAFKNLPADAFNNKKIISAVKGILPEQNLLLNDYLKQYFDFPLNNYFTVMGPCHAEEVASEKLSYLTFSGTDEVKLQQLAGCFKTIYLNTVLNHDVYGVQYAAILKNIYALGSGIAHGLEYGDNFLSVLIANCADEMAGFLRKSGIRNIEVGVHEDNGGLLHKKTANYAASVYLGDLLVTCYSLYSRNRTFGNMIGKGYAVKTALLEMNMIAEGYNASKCIYIINKEVKAIMPIADTIYSILWEGITPKAGFNIIEESLI